MLSFKIITALFLTVIVVTMVGCKKYKPNYNLVPKQVLQDFDFEKPESLLNKKHPNCNDFKYHSVVNKNTINVNLLYTSLSNCTEEVYMVTVDINTSEVIKITEKQLVKNSP